MQVQSMSPSQIRKAGIAALAKTLGPIGMVRFIQQFDMGTGDYTKDRSSWLDQISLEEITSSINKLRNIKPPSSK